MNSCGRAVAAAGRVAHAELEHMADGVGAGEDHFALVPGRDRAADAAELFDNGVGVDAGAQGEGNEPRNRLGVRGGAAAGFAHLREHFAEAVVVGVDIDIQGAAAGLGFIGAAVGDGGPRTRDGCVPGAAGTVLGLGLPPPVPGGDDLVLAASRRGRRSRLCS